MGRLRQAAKVSVLLCVLTSSACNVGPRQLYEPDAIPQLRNTQASVKLHLMRGELYALDVWHFELADSVIVGSGALHGIDRQVVSPETFRVPMDSVIFAETNEPKHPGPRKSPLRPRTHQVGATYLGNAKGNSYRGSRTTKQSSITTL